MTTIYRPIPGVLDAYAGIDGTIIYQGKVLEPYVANKAGHLRVKPLGWVHRLILAAYKGECPPGYESCHQDGDPAYNALINLGYGTRRDNVLDAVRHGTQHWAGRTECAQGHEFTPENTYHRPSRPTVRCCKQCRRKWERERYHRKKRPID